MSTMLPLNAGIWLCSEAAEYPRQTESLCTQTHKVQNWQCWSPLPEFFKKLQKNPQTQSPANMNYFNSSVALKSRHLNIYCYDLWCKQQPPRLIQKSTGKMTQRPAHLVTLTQQACLTGSQHSSTVPLTLSFSQGGGGEQRAFRKCIISIFLILRKSKTA